MRLARYYQDQLGNVYDTALGSVSPSACGMGAISVGGRGGFAAAIPAGPGGVANAFQVAALAQSRGFPGGFPGGFPVGAAVPFATLPPWTTGWPTCVLTDAGCACWNGAQWVLTPGGCGAAGGFDGLGAAVARGLVTENFSELSASPWCGDNPSARPCKTVNGVCICYSSSGAPYQALNSCCAAAQVGAAGGTAWCGDTDASGRKLKACTRVRGVCVCYDKSGTPYNATAGCCSAGLTQGFTAFTPTTLTYGF